MEKLEIIQDRLMEISEWQRDYILQPKTMDIIASEVQDIAIAFAGYAIEAENIWSDNYRKSPKELFSSFITNYYK